MKFKPFKKQKAFKSFEDETKYKKVKNLTDGKNNVKIISTSGKKSSGGFKISGGKVNNEQFIIVQAKATKSGFDYKTGVTLTQKEVGSKSASHIDYINRQKANLEDDVFTQVFDDLDSNKLIEEIKLESTSENQLADFNPDDFNIIEREFTSFKDKEDDYSFKKNDDYSNNINVNNKAQVDYLKDLKAGRTEASLKINDIDNADISKEFLNNLKDNNLKLFREMDKNTGEINLYIQGTKDNLLKEEANIKNNFSNQNIPSLKFSEIKDIKSNVMNIRGDKLSYEDINVMKKDLNDKGVGATTRLEISPKEQFNHEQLEQLASKTMLKTKEITGKNFDVIFAVHSNTEHNHVHIDINGKKADVMMSKEQLQTIKVIAAEVALEISPSKEAERHLHKELERLEEVKLIQTLQDKYNDNRKENASERHTNLSNLARAINKEVGLTEHDVKKIAQLEKLEGIAKFQENKIPNAIDNKEKEIFEKRLEFTKSNIEKVKTTIDEKLIDKIETFNKKWEEAKETSNHFKDLKDDYRDKQLDAVKDYAKDLKEHKKDKLAESVLKFGQGEKFNQFFDDYKSDRALKNIFSDQFNDKIDLSFSKQKEVELLKNEFQNRPSSKGNESLMDEGLLALNEAKQARNAIKQDEDPEGYRIEQLKFIDAQTITRDGYKIEDVQKWGDWAKKNGMDEKVVNGYVQASFERADKLVDAGILEEVKTGEFKFVDEKSKEILLENIGKSIDNVAEKNIEAYKDLKDERIDKVDDINKVKGELSEMSSFNSEIKNRDINEIIKIHKEEISEKFRSRL